MPERVARDLFVEGMDLAPLSAGCETVRDRSRIIQGDAMQWTKPAFTDLRFGFEITMYIATR